jgi:hypothetical protein
MPTILFSPGLLAADFGNKEAAERIHTESSIELTLTFWSIILSQVN